MNPATVPPEMQVYVNCMEKVKQRIGVVKWAVSTAEVLQQEHFALVEVIFVQFRKVLELIAFSSLSANKQAYAQAHTKFGEHWKAVKMLEVLEKLNPGFYPVPIGITTQADGSKLLAPLQDGFLTKQDFAALYDACGDVLHMRNPFSPKDTVISIGYSVSDWVSRIQALLGQHLVTLADENEKWVVIVPAVGKARALRGVASE